MRLNPTELKWTAPTENTDGSPVEEALAYRLAVNGVDFADFPGTLNPDGQYSTPVAPLNLPKGVSTLTLKAFYTTNPARISDPSNPIEIEIASVPNPPLAFAAV